MKLAFDPAVADDYRSPSQRIRRMSEAWLRQEAYCPRCGNAPLAPFGNNNPAADFHCPGCHERFELKSQKPPLGRKLMDGSHAAMLGAIARDEAPNLFVLRYDPRQLEVTDLIVVPRQFLVPSIIEKRRPLSPQARRAGWTGCNILLDRIAPIGRIPIVQSRAMSARPTVMVAWQRIAFLRDEPRVDARGWLVDVLNCVETLARPEFDLAEVYQFVPRLQASHPGNANVKPKIRQQLQRLRDLGYLEFLGDGRYRRL